MFHRGMTGLLCGVVVSLVVAAPAEELPRTLPAAHERIAQLQALVRQLEAEVAMLRNELAALREANQANVPATPVTAADAQAEADVDAEGAVEVDADMDTAVVPASPTREERRKSYGSSIEILRDMPAELQPHPQTGWDRLTFPRTERWLRGAVLEHPYDGREVIKEVSIRENPERRNDPNASEFIVIVSFEYSNFSYRGQTIRHQLASVRLYGNEAFARRARAVQPGVRARVTGTIVRVSPAYLNVTGLRSIITIGISHPRVHLHALTP